MVIIEIAIFKKNAKIIYRMNSQNPGIYLKNGNFGLEMSFEILGIRPIYDRI